MNTDKKQANPISVPLQPDAIWEALDEVKDPEIPVISLVEMGIVRDVAVDGSAISVTITPTFSGCPALHVMEQDIEARLRLLGATAVSVNVTLHPAWSSDWISDEAREKLRQFGIAPPPKHGGQLADVAFFETATSTTLSTAVCPRCSSTRTTLKNSFGSTLCRMIWVCNDCQEPFEQFKPL